MDLLWNSTPKEKIRLDFLPCKNTGKDIRWEEWHPENYLRIYLSDYNKLLPYFNNVFPLFDPVSGEEQSSFDVCWDNWIGIDDWKVIIKLIKRDMLSIESKDELLFFNTFVQWIENQIQWADIIVVEGNQ